MLLWDCVSAVQDNGCVSRSGRMVGPASDEAVVPVMAEEADAAPAFDLSKKKKKKKVKTGVDEGVEGDGEEDLGMPAVDHLGNSEVVGTPVVEEEVTDFAMPDFGAKKKKKKKKITFDDEDDDGLAGDAAGEGGERVPRRDAAPQPWDDDPNRDYTYEELINRAFLFLYGKNPTLAAGGSGRKKVSLQLPQVAREGTKKTVFLNFGAICKSIHRQQDHVLAYMSAELGTSGNTQDGGRLVIKGRFVADGIANVLKRYMFEYVICSSCRSPDTVLMRDANTRLYFVSCESCGAKRSVAPIRQGFMARTERRKKT